MLSLAQESGGLSRTTKVTTSIQSQVGTDQIKIIPTIIATIMVIPLLRSIIGIRSIAITPYYYIFLL